MANARSILPDFDVFVAPGVNVPRGAMTEAAAGTGASGLGRSRLFALSPVVAAVKGLGDAERLSRCMVNCAEAEKPMTAGQTVMAVVALSLVGALSYQAGKAIAPSRQDATTWGWIGVPVGLFTGVLGLGVMGAVANHRKG
jgi:hypothetical protein